jgi:hypothetical protein
MSHRTGTVPDMAAPEDVRPKVPYVSGEREMLDGWLDFHRATLLWKCAGLTDAQLKERSCPPSSMSLLGLVRHMTEVENGWFAGYLTGENHDRYTSPDDPDGDFDQLDSAPTEEVFAAFHAECDRSRRVAAGVDLEHTFVSRRGNTISLRWVYNHMIEEYARHNGHADLLRERIDGAVGD